MVVLAARAPRRPLLWASLIVAIGVVATPAAASVSSISLFSPSNGRDLTFQVYLPPGYSPTATERYPTVFSLHGIGGNSLQRAALYAPTLDARITAGELAPMIWVFPDGQTNSFYGNAFDGHKQVTSHMFDDILPYVDDHYRTRAHRNYRAMEGFSMGGFGAVMYAAKHPELFSALVEYGGALSTWQNLATFNAAVAEEMYDTVESNWLPYSLWDVTAANAAALRETVSVKMIVGDADPQFGSNTRFRDFLIGLGIDPHFQVLPGVQHLGGSYLNEGSGLRYLSDHFEAAPPPSADFNGDAAIDGRDFLLWQRQLGLTRDRAADGNYDGVVDAVDLALWRTAFAAGSLHFASHMAIPEPRAAETFALASLAFLLHRKRRAARSLAAPALGTLPRAI